MVLSDNDRTRIRELYKRLRWESTEKDNRLINVMASVFEVHKLTIEDIIGYKGQDTLPNRELSILVHYGYNNKEIAETLGLENSQVRKWKRDNDPI